MKIISEQASLEAIKTYQEVSITFSADMILEFEAIDSGLKGFKAIEKKVTPFTKNYDDYGLLTDSLKEFDISNWQLLTILDDDQIVGGALLAFQTTNVNMLGGRDDLVVVWDIRINEAYRHKGLGTALFDEIKSFAREIKATEINIETQNNNIKACKFYASQGAVIKSLKQEAYKDLPEETQIIWSIKLGGK